MAVNETTGVDPEVDRFAIYRVSTEGYINLSATWPRIDGGPLVGGDPDLKYYKRTNIAPPDADHRFSVAAQWGKVDAEPAPPEGHPAGTYQPAYTLTKLSIEELKAQIETEFQRQVEMHIPATAVPSDLASQIDAIARKQGGASLTPRQESKRQNAIAIGDVLAQLEARRDELFEDAEEGRDYDLTTGWGVS